LPDADEDRRVPRRLRRVLRRLSCVDGFYVVVMERTTSPAGSNVNERPPRPAPMARPGDDLFLANGCGACHTIRGTPANGLVGPDLTHVGSRLSIGAGALPNQPDALLRWIARTDT
jgi:cytochrome c oxidase subunit II